MTLTVVSVAFPFAVVGPGAVGGAEQILAMLDEELCAAGHRSIVLARAGSSVHGQLCPAPPFEPSEGRARAWAYFRRRLEELVQEHEPDVVHFHGFDFPEYVPALQGRAAVATLHLPPAWYSPGTFTRRDVHLVCVSESQRRSCPEEARIRAVISNGIRVGGFRPARSPGGYLAALGRICPEKGFHHALETAERLDLPLLLAGQVFPYPEHQAYFRQEILPRLGPRRRFVGAVGPRARNALLSRALALVVPSLCPETSSLVAMEAMASGTPVVALRAGALPEIIRDGETGLLADTPAGLGQQILSVGRLSRATCRREAEARFSAERMGRSYLDLYQSLARPRRAWRRSRPELIRTVDRLRELEPLWAALFAEDPIARPFSHPRWLLPWCDEFGPREVSSLAPWEADRLVGLAPLELQGDTPHQKTLKLLASGVSDALDVAPELRLGPAGGLARVVPRGQLKAVEYSRWRIERDLGTRVASAAEGCAYEYLEALLRLHGERWRARGQPGVLASAPVVSFHRRAVRAFSGAGLLRMEGLRVQGRLEGVLYGFAAHGRTCFYQSGFAPELAQFSPGALLIARSISRALAERQRTFDFLRGAERYKFRWGAVPRPLFVQRWALPREEVVTG